tara:strand:- start:11517 stop:13139 length:1623 start_codon:yes stop_codon:yes gene_type:complete
MGKLISSPSMKTRRNFGGVGFPDPGAGGAFDLATCVAKANELGFSGTGYGFSNPGGLSCSGASGTALLIAIDGYNLWSDGMANFTLATPWVPTSKTTIANAPTSFTNTIFQGLCTWLVVNSTSIGIDNLDNTKLSILSYSGGAATATKTQTSATLSGQIRGVFARGTKLWVNNTLGVAEYDWNGVTLASIVYSGNTYALTDSEGSAGQIWWSPDGYRLYMLRYATRIITMHTASTAWDVTTLLFSGVSIDATAQGSALNDFVFADDHLDFIMATSASVQGNISHYDCPAPLLPGMPDGAIGWYDASDLTTLFQDAAMTTPVTASGQNVRAWKDKSGNDNHLTNFDGATMTYVTAAGLHWVHSTNSDLRSDAVAALANLTQFTMCAGLQTTSFTATTASPALTDAASGFGADDYYTEFVAGNDSATYGFLLGVNTYDDTMTTNTSYVWTGQWDGGAVAGIDRAIPTINQVSTPDTNTVAFSSTQTSATGMRISSSLHDGVTTNDQRLYAFAIYSGILTAAQLSQVRVEMATKSGATLRNTV